MIDPMIHFSDHSKHQTHLDLPPDLRQIDDGLAELAARQPLPPGLTDRVFNASVAALPQRLRLRGRGSAAPAAPHRMRFHRPVWGQLAMAASIGLAFVIAAWFLAVPGGVMHGGDRGGMIAEHTESPRVRTVAQRSFVPLSREAEWLLLETGFNGDGASHLIETRDLTFAELQRESQRLFDELEL